MGACRPITDLQELLGYRFDDQELLRRALTHSSLEDSGTGGDYERLEFLGDAVLELVTREGLLERFPAESEGDLTRRKIKIVQKGNLALHGRRLGLISFARTGKSFDRSVGGAESLAADIIEAIAGAIYLDSGLSAAAEFVKREVLLPSIEDDKGPLADSRSELQEYCQGEGLPLPVYSLIDRKGKDHSPIFTIAVLVDGHEIGRGHGPSRRAAREAAAWKALATIERTE